MESPLAGHRSAAAAKTADPALASSGNCNYHSVASDCGKGRRSDGCAAVDRVPQLSHPP